MHQIYIDKMIFGLMVFIYSAFWFRLSDPASVQIRTSCRILLLHRFSSAEIRICISIHTRTYEIMHRKSDRLGRG